MRAIARSGLPALSALAFVVAATSAQTTPPATGAAPAVRPASDPNQVLATVNGETITRGELLNFLSRYPLPSGDEERIYRDAIDTLINTHLVNQFLTRQNRKVPEQKVDEAVAALKKELKDNGMSLELQLQRTQMTEDAVRKEYANRIRWIDFLNDKATDAELKSFESAHKDLFSGAQVKASHILLKVDPKASPAEKDKVREKLQGIKRDIEANKISFSEAANKYSEDPGNTEGAGGDIGYFGLNSGVIEEFARPAFALKKGAISDPIETPYGFHLIQVTDRKEGMPFDFEQNKLLVKQVYAADLQKNVLSAERKKAEAAGKIVIKPMPADLFPKAPAQTPAAGATKPEPRK